MEGAAVVGIEAEAEVGPYGNGESQAEWGGHGRGEEAKGHRVRFRLVTLCVEGGGGLKDECLGSADGSCGVIKRLWFVGPGGGEVADEGGGIGAAAETA